MDVIRPSLVAIPVSLLIASFGLFLALKARQTVAIAAPSAPRHPVTQLMLTEAEKARMQPAPVFSLKDSNGKPWDSKTLDSKKPTLLLAILEDCPCSMESQPYFNDLARTYGSAIQVLGFIKGDEKTAREYKTIHSVTFPVLADPGAKVARAFGAPASVYSALLVEGKIVKLWPGYSKLMLAELNEKLAGYAGVELKPVDLSGAPDEYSSGCSLD